MAGTRVDQEQDQASKGHGRSWSIPMPGKRFVEPLLPVATLAAAGAYTLTDPVDVFKSRLLHLYITASAQAISNAVSIVPEVSLDPLGQDSSFFPIGVTDGVVALGDLAVAPSTVYTEHNIGVVVFTPLALQTPVAISTSDVLSMVVTVDVNQAYWIRFRVAEVGVTSTPSDLQLDFSKST